MAWRTGRVLGVSVSLFALTSWGCGANPRVEAMHLAAAAGGGGATRPAPATKPAGPAAAGFSLTIYSTADPATFSPQDLLQEQTQGGGGTVVAPGFGVVRERRAMVLKSGENRLEFADVAAGIDPTTVAFRSLTAPDTTAVLEQNFEYDLTDGDKLLNKYLGREVELTLKQVPRLGEGVTPPVRGTLLAFQSNQYNTAGASFVLHTNDPQMPIVIQRSDNIDSVRLAGMESGLVSKPTLRWKVAAEKAGPHDVEVTYQTDGLTWRADYNLLVAPDDATADVSAWVTVLNGSGLAYPEAKLKLVAGSVQRFESEQQRRRRAQSGPGAGLFGGKASEEGFEEKGFFEYHLYTLGRTTSLPNNSTKQIELFEPKTGVKVEKVFVYYGLSVDQRWSVLPSALTDQSFGTKSNRSVDIYLRFKNSAANRMGVPLPAGRVRVYKVDDADGSREFIGEDVIQHTPRDEQVLVRLGSAFDIVGDRVQSDFQKVVDADVINESFEITLRNHKKEPVRVIVKENLYRWFNWEITASSDKYEKQDHRTIHFPVALPPDGEKKVTYTVRYTW